MSVPHPASEKPRGKEDPVLRHQTGRSETPALLLPLQTNSSSRENRSTQRPVGKADRIFSHALALWIDWVHSSLGPGLSFQVCKSYTGPRDRFLNVSGASECTERPVGVLCCVLGVWPPSQRSEGFSVTASDSWLVEHPRVLLSLLWTPWDSGTRPSSLRPQQGHRDAVFYSGSCLWLPGLAVIRAHG